MSGMKGSRNKQEKNQQVHFYWAKKESAAEILNELSNRLKKEGLEITNKKVLIEIIRDL